MTERERLIVLLNNSLTGSVGLSSLLSESIADYLLVNGVIVPPEYAKIVRCSECENLKLLETKGKYAHCKKYGFDFFPFEADTRGHFCVQYK